VPGRYGAKNGSQVRPIRHRCLTEYELTPLQRSQADWGSPPQRRSNLAVKKRLEAVGIDPVRFGDHSLRAGFVTQAVRNGAAVQQIMQQTGHRTEATVQVYVREHDPLKNNAVTRLGL
jgi:integrase